MITPHPPPPPPALSTPTFPFLSSLYSLIPVTFSPSLIFSLNSSHILLHPLFLILIRYAPDPTAPGYTLTPSHPHPLTPSPPPPLTPLLSSPSNSYVLSRYAPDPTAPGYTEAAKQRVIRMVEAQVDPMEPPKHLLQKAIRG